MKKVISLVLVCLFVYALCACEKSPRDPVTATPGTQSEGVDIDLTKLSRTMVYSEVYNMMVAPDKYVGKIVRMRGQFALYEDAESGARYFACIIADATACCSQVVIHIRRIIRLSAPKSLSRENSVPTRKTEIFIVT